MIGATSPVPYRPMGHASDVHLHICTPLESAKCYRYVLVVSHAGEAMATERDPAKGNKKINTIIVITWRSVHGKPMQMPGVLDFIYFLFRSFA